MYTAASDRIPVFKGFTIKGKNPSYYLFPELLNIFSSLFNIVPLDFIKVPILRII